MTLQAYTEYEFDSISNGDEEIEFVIHPFDSKYQDVKFKKRVPSEMKIGELKRMILYKT